MAKIWSLRKPENDFFANELIFDALQNVHTLDDAKKMWTMVVIVVISNLLFYIEKIKLRRKDASSFPVWLLKRFEFVSDIFMPLF